MSMKTLGQALLLVMMAAGLCGAAAAQSNVAARSIQVTGDGEASGPPDRAQVSAGVQTLAKTVAQASQENQAIVDAVMKALERQGIEKKNIQTANYSIWPEQQHDPQQPNQISITGYRVSNVVNVIVEDIDKVGDVLAAVTGAGANSVHGVQFMVKDTAALEQQARAAAMADARARAGELAKLAGVELGEVLTISMSYGGGYPGPMMAGRGGDLMMMEAAAVPGISPGQLSVNVQVYVTYAIR
ncbi:MAG TPA: SIMPL domain-containing protein [Woeseiaceae bacterium]|nr:SIMPL domain-containing protein [Woeseiaceae bacterium]